MPTCRVGAHTFIFQQYGFDQARQTEKILATVAEAGYQAVELHNTALDGEDYRVRIEGPLRRAGLELIGASNGQPFWNVAESERIYDVLDLYSDKLSDMDGDLKCGISCSGKQYAQRSDAENDHLLQTWTELAEIFLSKDVTMCYHNHGEPLEDILFIVENIQADLLPLNPDLDWLRVGGVDPEQFLRQHADRISMLHIRDYHLDGERTAALGQGDVDYAHLGRILDEIGFTGDLVVELALPSGTPPDQPVLDLLKESREHIRETMGI